MSIFINIWQGTAAAMSFTEQELAEFKAEAIDLLDMAEKSLLSLDKGAEFKPAYDAIFRGFHNLKGAAGMMELTRLAAHTHELESRLIKFKNASGIPKSHINMFLRGIDAARALLNNESVTFDFSVAEERASSAEVKSEAKSEIKAEAFAEFFAEGEEIVDRVFQTLQKIELSGSDKAAIDSLYRDIHSLKGSAYLFSFQKVGQVAHAMETALEPLRNEGSQPSKNLIEGLFKGLQLLESLLAVAKGGMSDDDFGALVESFVTSMTETEAPATEVVAQKSSPVVASISPAVPAPASAPLELEGSGSIRVPVGLLDNLMALMGEMVLVRNQVLQFSSKSNDHELLSMSKRLNLVTSEIQGEMMKTRMQPIGNVLSKFNRVVRDLSQELKKSIHLTLFGVETELDKSLLEAIKDPLTHIVRNGCDHGIETPTERRRVGKPESGNISIRAYHEGGQVFVDISDDGKGLQPEVILKKALEKGLLTSAQASKMSEKEIFNLIFAPGFSTAAAITNVSGRGVGMDVVRTNLEKIGGAVELSSVPGKGTTIKLKIPLTLAIIPALMVKSGESLYAIPQVKLEELVLIHQSSEEKIELLHGAPVYRLRGRLLPLVDLNQTLMRSAPRNYSVGTHTVAVVNTGQTQYGLIIDEVRDTADIVVKPLTRLLKSFKVYSGATILGDGSVSLILDVSGIAQVANLGQRLDRAQEQAAKSLAAPAKSLESQEYLMVKLNSPTKHAIVLGLVHRLEEFRRSQVEYSGSQAVIRYRETVLPVFSTSELLGYGREASSATDLLSVVVIKRAGHLYGLEVEGIVDTLHSAAETHMPHARTRGIYGCMDVGSELVVVIDPFELITLALPEKFGKPEVQEAPALVEQKQLYPSETHIRKRVLVAEDTLFFRKAIKKVLEGAGFEVVTANDGMEALEILQQPGARFDLIVSDIEMPRMDGFQFAAKVRESEMFSDVPMIALSSRLDDDYVREGYRVGFNVYLEKLKAPALLAAVEKLLSSHQEAA